jgi:hypothetical protein
MISTALLDKAVGRVWLLTKMRDPKGKETCDKFQEADIQNLWDTEAWDFALASSNESLRKTAWDYSSNLLALKDGTRPTVVLEAESKVRSERLSQEKGQQPKAKDSAR